MIPVLINGTFFTTVSDEGEAHHISFIGYGTVICKRVRFILDKYKCSLFSGKMDAESFSAYIKK